LVLGNILITLLAVAGMGYFVFDRTRETNSYLSTRLNENVYQQAISGLENTSQSHTAELENFFVQIRVEVNRLGDALGRMISQPAREVPYYWDANTALFRIETGSWDNSNDEQASVFLPASAELSSDLVHELDTARQLDFSVPAILQTNPDYVALYYGGLFGETIYYPNINLANIVPADFDVTQRTWFLAAAPDVNPGRQPVWSTPYLDAASNGLVITNSAPVFNSDGTFRGVAAIDIQLNRITSLISEIQIGDSGYAFLVDKDLRVIAMPTGAYDDLQINPANMPLGDVLTAEKFLDPGVAAVLMPVLSSFNPDTAGITTVDLLGSDRFISYAPVPEVGYGLVTIVPVQELLTEAIVADQQIAIRSASTIFFSIVIIVTILLVSLVASTAISNRMTQPLQSLTRTAEEISSGNINAVASITSRDELGTLARAFNDMTSQMRETIANLETRVQERTSGLTHQALQLQAASQVAREAASQTDLAILLSRTADLITDLFSFYHAGIFLLDDTGEYAVLQAASSSGGKRMLERGHKLEVARQGLVGAAVRQNKAQIIMDVSTAPDFYKNPDLPETVSEAAFPLAIQDRIIGVLDIQSTSGNVFSREDMQVIQALGDQIALAIQNTRLLREREASMALLERATLQDIRKVWRKKVGDKKTAFRYSASEIVAVSPQGQKVSKKAKGVHTLEIPIVLRGQTIGKFELSKKGGEHWTDADRNLSENIATQIGLALENARLLEEAQQRASQEQTLSDLSAKLSKSLDIETLLQTTIKELHQLPGVSESSVVITSVTPADEDE
jgi:GAF domain-containing protein/HAMP domain-containing protein